MPGRPMSSSTVSGRRRATAFRAVGPSWQACASCPQISSRADMDSAASTLSSTTSTRRWAGEDSSMAGEGGAGAARLPDAIPYRPAKGRTAPRPEQRGGARGPRPCSGLDSAAHHLEGEPAAMPTTTTRWIGLSLGADLCWPLCFEEILRRLDLAVPWEGEQVRVGVERVTIEPFDLRQRTKYAVVLDRLTHWYSTTREWIKKSVILDDVYVLNNP